MKVLHLQIVTYFSVFKYEFKEIREIFMVSLKVECKRLNQKRREADCVQSPAYSRTKKITKQLLTDFKSLDKISKIIIVFTNDPKLITELTAIHYSGPAEPRRGGGGGGGGLKDPRI